MRPLDTVGGADVYVVQSLHSGPSESANDKLCRLLFFIGALKDAGAARVTAVVPYLCYARKDRRTKPNDPVTTRYVAGMFEAVGTDCIVTLEVHNPVAFENAFRCRTVTLTGTPLFVDYVRALKDDKLCVVSPDTGGAKRAELFREALEAALGRPVGKAFADKHRSAGVVSGDLFVGDVAGATALVIDDLISTGGTLLRAARAARQAGARRVIALVTHGLFMAGAAEVLADPAIDRLVVTDAVPAFRLARADPRATRSTSCRRRRCSPRRSGGSTRAKRSATSSCFEQPLEPCGVRRRDPQIEHGRGAAISPACADWAPADGRSQGAPAAWRGGSGRTETTPRTAIAQAARDAAPDVLAGPGGAEPLALKAQEGDLVERIDRAQAGIELQAVDDPDRIAEPDVLGTQVAVPVDDAAAAHARSPAPRPAGQKPALHAVDPPHQPRRQPESRIEQHPPIVGTGCGANRQRWLQATRTRIGPAIELHERRGETIELPGLDAAILNGVFERLAFVEPAHDHEPVHDRARRRRSTGQRASQSAARRRDRRRARACD